jgi:excisionase family DNA binding protein
MKPIARVEDFPFRKKAWYSAADIGRLLGVSTPTVRRWISGGKLFAAHPDRRGYRIPLASFMQFLGVPAQIRWTRGKKAPKIEDDELEPHEL